MPTSSPANSSSKGVTGASDPLNETMVEDLVMGDA